MIPLCPTAVKSTWLAISLSLLASVAEGQSVDQFYRGYAIVSQAHELPAELEQPIYRHVQSPTIFGALTEILEGTGYRLAHDQVADPEIAHLYRQPYPALQRNLGPESLHAILKRLAGPGWQLVVDPVNRLLSFELRSHYRCGGASPASCSIER